MWLPSGDSRAESRLNITHTTRRRGYTGPLRQETLSRPGRTQQFYLVGNLLYRKHKARSTQRFAVILQKVRTILLL